jgi:hypothetical protein
MKGSPGSRTCRRTLSQFPELMGAAHNVSESPRSLDQPQLNASGTVFQYRADPGKRISRIEGLIVGLNVGDLPPFQGRASTTNWATTTTSIAAELWCDATKNMLGKDG